MNPTRLVMTTLLIASLAVSCFAEPMPDRLRAKLDQLVGTWKVETKIGDEVVTETVTLKWGTDNNTVAYQGVGESFSTGRALTFSGVLGWSSVEKKIAEHGFDSKGGTMTASHNIDEETWIGSFESSVVSDGEKVIAKSLRAFEWQTADQWSITQTKRTINGQSQEDIRSVFRRIQTDSDPIAKRLIEAEIRAIENHWRQKNLSGLVSEFTEDGIRATNISLLPIQGSDAIRASLEPGFATGNPSDGTEIHAKVLAARFLTDQHILADGTWWLVDKDGETMRTGKWGNVWKVNAQQNDCKMVLESAYADLPLESVANRDLPNVSFQLPEQPKLRDAELLQMLERNIERYARGALNSDSSLIAQEFTVDGVRSVSEMPQAYRGRLAILESLKVANEGTSPYAKTELKAVILNAQRLSDTIAIANGVWQVSDSKGSVIDFGQWGNVLQIQDGEVKLIFESAGSYQP